MPRIRKRPLSSTLEILHTIFRNRITSSSNSTKFPFFWEQLVVAIRRERCTKFLFVRIRFDSSLFIFKSASPINERNYENPTILLSKEKNRESKKRDAILRKTHPSPSVLLVKNQTFVLTFALRGPAASSTGTMHANYQAAIMIRSRRRAEGTS